MLKSNVALLNKQQHQRPLSLQHVHQRCVSRVPPEGTLRRFAALPTVCEGALALVGFYENRFLCFSEWMELPLGAGPELLLMP